MSKYYVYSCLQSVLAEGEQWTVISHLHNFILHLHLSSGARYHHPAPAWSHVTLLIYIWWCAIKCPKLCSLFLWLLQLHVNICDIASDHWPWPRSIGGKNYLWFQGSCRLQAADIANSLLNALHLCCCNDWSCPFTLGKTNYYIINSIWKKCF